MDSIITWAFLMVAAVLFLGRYFINDFSSYRNDNSIDVHRYTSVDASFKAMERNRYHR